MKKIFRTLVFMGAALYLTSLWNQGFQISLVPAILVRTVIIFSVIYHLILPVAKLLLLPLNILSFGLISFLAFALFIYLAGHFFGLVTVKAWLFPGFIWMGISLQKTQISYLVNLVLSSLSISFIINLLDKVL